VCSELNNWIYIYTVLKFEELTKPLENDVFWNLDNALIEDEITMILHHTLNFTDFLLSWKVIH